MQHLGLAQPKHEILREAAAAGDTTKVQCLLSLGADPNAADAEGWTALHWSSSNAALVTLLLQNGAAVDAADAQGKTTLHWAATDGYADVADVLLANGAQVNKVDHDNWTPLQWAHGQAAVAELLLSHGADVHTRDKFGKTVLHWSSQDGFVDVVRMIIAAGAGINNPDKDGMTPLHWAAHGGHAETVELLLQAGARASIDSEDSQGTSPLAWAAYAGRDQVVQLMVDQQHSASGRSITERNLLSAARAAAIQGHLHIFAVLAAEYGLQHPQSLPSLLTGPLAPDPAVAFAAMTGLCVYQRRKELQHAEVLREQQAVLAREREELNAVRVGAQHLVIQAAGVVRQAMQLARTESK